MILIIQYNAMYEFLVDDIYYFWSWQCISSSQKKSKLTIIGFWWIVVGW